MPIEIPRLDARTYQDLVEEALARIPVHNPEWTNFNRSDPGVTLVELFAFLFDSVLYRANQIPERSRRKFLSLLGVPLQPAASARGIVTLSNERGAQLPVLVARGTEVRAGEVPFRTERTVDVLPVEAHLFVKQRVAPSATDLEYYRRLYASFRGGPPSADVVLYRTARAEVGRSAAPIALAETLDRSLWIALLVRPVERGERGSYADGIARARARLAGRVLALGLVPAVEADGRAVAPSSPPRAQARLDVSLPALPPQGQLPEAAEERNASYRTLASLDVPDRPVIVEVPLPASADDLALWSNLEPLEAGTRDFPPALEEAEQADRLVTWLRVSAPGASVDLVWAGINAVEVTQRARVLGEEVDAGRGEPDEARTLSRRPVLPGTVRVQVGSRDGAREWREVEDLLDAGPEVPVTDPRLPAGTRAPPPASPWAFALDAEAGRLRFGDGVHGARLPAGARVRADYDYGVGRAGNVGPGSIDTGPALPAGVRVTNPVATWGGADAEAVAEGEKQIPRHLQHRDRAVTAADFEALAHRTPGVEVGRVEVLPAWHPRLATSEPGDAPGVVTIVVVPAQDPFGLTLAGADPFVDAVAAWLAPRRLVTTELVVRRPVFEDVWISVGIDVLPGFSFADVKEAVKRAVAEFLSPLPDPGLAPLDAQAALLSAPSQPSPRRGWPLRKAVTALELAIPVSRVDGVASVRQVRVAGGSAPEAAQVAMVGLELPRLAGMEVASGYAPDLDAVRGRPAPGGPSGPVPVPVPIIPEECR